MTPSGKEGVRCYTYTEHPNLSLTAVASSGQRASVLCCQLPEDCESNQEVLLRSVFEFAIYNVIPGNKKGQPLRLPFKAACLMQTHLAFLYQAHHVSNEN